MIGSVNLALCELYMFQYLVNFNIAKIIKKNTMFWKVYIKKGQKFSWYALEYGLKYLGWIFIENYT